MLPVRENPSLPKDSLYLPIEPFWHHRTQMSNGPQSQEPADYARDVVRMIDSKKRPLRFWAGAKSTFAWILYYFVPLRLRLFLIARQFGLLKLRGLLSK